MPYRECSYTNRPGEFLNPEELNEIRTRIYACTTYGRGLVCCEESHKISVTLPTIPTTVESTTIVTSSRVTVLSSPMTDPTHHPNYRIFKDLKCGGSSLNRVAYGRWRVT